MQLAFIYPSLIGKIRVRAERGSMTEALKQEIATHKQEIIALLNDGQTSSEPDLKRTDRKGNAPLSYAQQRLWFLDELEAWHAGI